MIVDQEQFLLDRDIAYNSRDLATIRAFCNKYDMHKKLSDTQLIERLRMSGLHINMCNS